MNGKSKANTVQEYMANVPSERQQTVQKVHAAIQKAVPKLKPHMMSGMIGYGNFHYKYASGREGDWSLVCLANQKNYVSVYLCAADDKGYLAEQNKDRLGKVSVGKSCIRFKKLEDINLDVLGELCRRAEKLGDSGNFML